MSTRMAESTAAEAPARPVAPWRLVREGRVQWLRVAILTAAVANAIVFLVALPVVLGRVDHTRDLNVYYRLLLRLHAGGEIYFPRPAPGPHTVRMIYLYPPFFAAVFKLMPVVSFATFARTWSALNVIAFWAYAGTLARLARGRLLALDVLVAGLALSLCPGSLNAIGLGQADPLLWPLIGLGLASVTARTPALTLFTLVKPLPLVALACAAIRERTRAIAGILATGAVATLVACIAFGVPGFVKACLDWLRYIAPALGQGSWVPFNLSLSFAPLRLAHALGWLGEGGVLPAGVRAYLTTVSLGGPVAVAWLARRTRPELQYGLVIAAAVVLSPIVWNTYLPVLLAPAAVALQPVVAGRWKLRYSGTRRAGAPETAR